MVLSTPGSTLPQCLVGDDFRNFSCNRRVALDTPVRDRLRVERMAVMAPREQPVGDPAPPDGRLPGSALQEQTSPSWPLAVYVHVPFCRVRCGYCDFNTYAPGELSGDGTSMESYAAAARGELELAAAVLAEAPGEPLVTSVFFGGGTPTLLAPEVLAGLLAAVRDRWPFADGAEVTTEANPDSVTPASLRHLADAGVTRVSVGMQSAVPHVLAALERTHDPAGVERAVAGARAAGLDVSLDLIYGAPGESLADWRASLEAAIALAPDHLSAYALIVEEGTRLGAQVRRGEVPEPDEDDLADKYELADALLAGAGYRWYEVSNWARPGHECRHNLTYWHSGNWWGIGPGAHSHIGGVRWWNVKHPGTYAARLAGGHSPAAGRELLTPRQRAEEDILLRTRLRGGPPVAALTPAGRAALDEFVAGGLLGPTPDSDRPRTVELTLRGRLLADLVVRRLLG